MSNTNTNKLFTNLQALRGARGITFEELSKRSGVPRPTIFGLKNHEPAQKTLKALAEALEVSIVELLGIEEGKNQETNGVVEVPVWDFESYEPSTAPGRTRFLANVDAKCFGLILDPRISGCPKGTIFYFTTDKEPGDGDTVLIKSNNEYYVKKLSVEGNKTRFLHLRYDEVESFKDFELLGTCFSIVIDPYSSKFDR